jgi:hypothetical protein
MKKLKLTEWAAIAEIIGTIAVVVSLLFVVISINHNTKVMQASNDNFIYELQFARTRDIVASPGMALIYTKVNRKMELSEEEQERFYWDKMQELSTWELAFNRHRDGLFSTEQWIGWNNYFEVAFISQFPATSWIEVRDFYRGDFQKHVDAVYSAK